MGRGSPFRGCRPLPFLPPQGEIDHTVLLLCAQFLLFAATLLGVDGYYDKMRDLIKK